jgi:hypothetical protein
MDMVDTVESGLKTHFATKPLLPCQLIRDREVQMNDGKKKTKKTGNNMDLFFVQF